MLTQHFIFQSPEEGDLSCDLSRLTLNRKISREESDESEASSVCSERSFDSYRRNDVSIARKTFENIRFLHSILNQLD